MCLSGYLKKISNVWTDISPDINTRCYSFQLNAHSEQKLFDANSMKKLVSIISNMDHIAVELGSKANWCIKKRTSVFCAV